MDQALTIVEFVIALGVLIFIHEFGHYIMARLVNIEVEEFGMGFPPRMLRLFTFKGTEFTLNWIPFGAFVRPKGENDPEIPGGLASSNPFQRFTVLIGGPLFNIVTGILLFSLLFSSVGAPVPNLVQISNVALDSPASAAGLLAKDIVYQVNGQEITSSEQLRTIVAQNLDQEIIISVKRGEEIIETRAMPRKNPPAGQDALGIEMGSVIRPISWFESLPLAAQVTYNQVYQLITLPVKLIQGTVSAEESRVVGPVGMFTIYDQVKEMDAQTAEELPASTPLTRLLNRIYLLATISIALGFTNLLPLPALDGGRILFLLPEIFLHKRVPAKYENLVHIIGFATLIALMVFITAQDILRPLSLP